MSNKELINSDSSNLAMAVANNDIETYRSLAQDIWRKHSADLNDPDGYWHQVRRGANHIIKDSYNSKEKTSAFWDFFRDILPGAGPGSSGLSNAEIKNDGSILIHKSGLEETIRPNETAERQQKGQR